MLKQGWMLKSQDYINFSKLWFSSWRDAVCWQITQSSFVSDWQWPCVEQRDGHTRIKIKLDEIGPKKQEVEQSVLTLSSLMLKPHRPSWLPSSHPHRLPKGCPGVGRKYFRTSCSSSSLFQALNCTQRGPKPSSDGYGATWREPEPVFPEVCLNSMAHHGTCCSARPRLMGLDCDILPCLPHRS